MIPCQRSARPINMSEPNLTDSSPIRKPSRNLDSSEYDPNEQELDYATDPEDSGEEEVWERREVDLCDNEGGYDDGSEEDGEGDGRKKKRRRVDSDKSNEGGDNEEYIEYETEEEGWRGEDYREELRETERGNQGVERRSEEMEREGEEHDVSLLRSENRVGFMRGDEDREDRDIPSLRLGDRVGSTRGSEDRDDRDISSLGSEDQGDSKRGDSDTDTKDEGKKTLNHQKI